MNNYFRPLLYYIMVILLFIIPFCSLSCEQNDNAGEEELEEEIPINDSIFAFGKIVAGEVYNTVVDFSATAEKLLVREGEKVKKSDALLVLDMDEYNFQLKNKQAELNIARMELEQMQKELEQVKNEILHYQSIYDNILNKLEKQWILHNEGAISLSELDELQQELEETEMVVRNLQIPLGDSLNDTPEMKMQREQISLIQNTLRNMEQKVRRDYIEENKIISIFEHAVVSEIKLAAGDKIAAGEKLFSLIDLNSLLIEAEVSEEFILDIRVGSEAAVTPLADRSRTYRGTVKEITGRAFEKKGETIVPVLLAIDNNDGLLLPGFNVDVEFSKSRDGS